MKLYPYIPSPEAVQRVLAFVRTINEPYGTDAWQIDRLGLDRLHFTLLVAKDETGQIHGYLSFTEIANGVWTIEAAGVLNGGGLSHAPLALFEEGCQYAFKVLKAHKLVIPAPETNKAMKRFLRKRCGFVKCGYLKNYLITARGDKIGVVLLSRDADDAPGS